MKEFILKSKKVYFLLGTGIMVCLCVLTANITASIYYNKGLEQAKLYNQRYINTYSTLAENYSKTFPNEPLENALNSAKTNCLTLKDAVIDGRYEEWLTLKD